MTTKLLLPLLNRKAIFFKGPTLYLSPKVSIETILPADFGIIFNSAPDEYKSIISPKSKCIVIEDVNPGDSLKIARIEGLKILFLLNYFKQLEPAVISFAVQITKKQKARFDQVFDLPVIADAYLKRYQHYRVRTNINRDTFSDFYNVITEVYKKNPNILITLDRFNSALFRVQLFDKIIDITVSLESLINGETELKNRFSVFNAWVSESDPRKRNKCFTILASLYDARSAIVHDSGLSEKAYRNKIDPISANWDDIIRIAEKVLGYHLLYVYKNGITKWYKHQENLALGIEHRIV